MSTQTQLAAIAVPAAVPAAVAAAVAAVKPLLPLSKAGLSFSISFPSPAAERVRGVRGPALRSET